MFPTGVPAPSVEQMTAMEEQNGIAGDVSQLRIGNMLVIGDRPTLLKTVPGSIPHDQCLLVLGRWKCTEGHASLAMELDLYVENMQMQVVLRIFPRSKQPDNSSSNNNNNNST